MRLLGDFFILPPDPDRHPLVTEKFRHNVLVNTADSIAWLLGDSFLSASTILPVFASKLTDSPLVIGLIPALLNAGWFLPQFFMTSLVARQPRKLPMVGWLTAIERLPFLGFCLLALSGDRLSHTAAIAIFLALIVWRAVSSGVVALPWQELMAIVIPSSHRGRYFGYSHLLGEVAGIVGAGVAAYFLSSLAYPGNFALIFLLGFLCTVVSFVFLMSTAEPHIPPSAHTPASNRPSLRQATAILRGNTNFRTFLLSRSLSYMGIMASGFLAVYAVERFRLPDEQAAIFTALLLVGAMIGFAASGWAGDRWGHKVVLVCGGFLWTMALLVALLAPSTGVYYLVFVLVGISNGTAIVADLNIVMEFGRAAERPMYIGLARTIMGPALLVAPMIGGWIAQVGGYPLMFAVSLAFAVAGLLLLWFGVTEPRRQSEGHLVQS